jgi:ubiquinone/menaquinone biosynthesis C-methylase UbiE
MDDIARYNQQRWQELADANALFTRAKLNLDVESAQEMVDPEGELGELQGKRVLCLASGGGQQSVAFALLGAQVTVVDLSEAQLQRDREAAAHYGLNITIIQADMRDLSRLESDSFDLVDQPYSLNFVPEAREVFRQVSRVIKHGGLYRVACANPFAAGITERDWNGEGYTVKRPYVQGERITYEDQDWVYNQDQHALIAPPQEFRQTLSVLLNGLIENGFTLKRLKEVGSYSADAAAEPGTWDHFTAILPPWLSLLSVYTN